MKFLIQFFLVLQCLPLAASLSFEEELIEVHADPNTQTVSKDFKFSNGGPETVTISEADAGCSCVSVKVSGGKLTYAPGEAGVLRATFELGSFQGAVDKPINVWLKGDPDDKPSSTVVLRVHIPQMITIEPKTLKWEAGKDVEPLIMDVKMDYEKPIHVTSIASSNTSFAVKLIVLKEGEHYQVEVTPTGSEPSGLSVIRIETDLEVEKQRIQQGFAVMKPAK